MVDMEKGDEKGDEKGVVAVRVNESREGGFTGRERTQTFSPIPVENAPTVLTFSNIIVTLRTTTPPKILLNDLSGSIPGGFWAIMGSSGSGKTLLLSALSLRLDTKVLDMQGEIRLNGRPFSRGTLKSMSSYLMQEDLLHSELTVQETLTYASQLRMASGSTPKEREDRITEVLTMLGIDHIRNVIIGNTRRKGVSGGERKRVSIAVELLSRPKLVFLDEPTSGLDSTTSLAVCEALKGFTVRGECTVICTIHQPQPKIFDLFDGVILLKQGSMVYHGSTHKLDRFLIGLGLPLPADMAMADYLLNVISPNEENEHIVDRASRIKHVVPVDLSFGQDKQILEGNGPRTWFDQFYILLQRNLQQYLRNSDLIFMNFMVTVVTAVFIGSGLWYQIGNGQASLQTRLPSLFFCVVSQGIIASLQTINSFPTERAIMLRERQAGSYQVSSYFMAKTVVDVISGLWSPILFSVITYFMIGYQLKPAKFFKFMFLMVLNSQAPMSAATAISCICGTIEYSVVLLSVVIEGCRLFGGFFASPAQMESIPDWKFADSLSFTKYAFVGVALNELSGLEIECDINPPSSCSPITSGEQIIAANGYDLTSLDFCIGMLIVLIVGARILAYVGLRYLK
jgi:ATP-binding cassette subfamily G (WHITE) protein 2